MTNESIKAAFQKFWEHVVSLVSDSVPTKLSDLEIDMEIGGDSVEISDEEIIEMLIQEDVLPVVADSDGSFLADEYGNILLW